MNSPEPLEPFEGYEPFFGFREAPFNLAPDPRFLFASASHSTALTQVAHALQRREPLVIVTGEIGTGKTLLCRTVLQRLPGKVFLSVISDPLLERDDLLKQMLQDFGVISKDRTRLTATSRHELVQTLHAFLSSLAPIHAHAVVIVDEAQHLQPDVLEQIRLLSNVEDRHGTALGIILVGQTDLEQRLSRPELRQLHQRVSRWLRLAALNRDEVGQYVEHRIALARNGKPRLSVVGGTELARGFSESAGTRQGVEFSADALDALSQLSRGVPRVINLLCDRSLEEACACRLRLIDRQLIQASARELGIDEHAVGDAPHIDRPVVETAPRMVSARARLAAVPGFAKYAGLAIFAALATLAVLTAVRSGRPAATAPIPSTPVVSPTTRTSATPSEPAAATPDTGTSAQKAAESAATAPPPEAAAPASTGEQFDIVVASFRTEARAASVTAEVAALGLPSRRRVSADWQQVISGPFASRTDAEVAQQRLASAGLAGTQINRTAR